MKKELIESLVCFRVSNIEASATDAEIRDSFNDVMKDDGENPPMRRIENMYRPKYKDTGKAMHFAFFEVRVENAQRFESLNRCEFLGRTIKVEKCKNKRDGVITVVRSKEEAVKV